MLPVKAHPDTGLHDGSNKFNDSETRVHIDHGNCSICFCSRSSISFSKSSACRATRTATFHLLNATGSCRSTCRFNILPMTSRLSTLLFSFCLAATTNTSFHSFHAENKEDWFAWTFAARRMLTAIAINLSWSNDCVLTIHFFHFSSASLCVFLTMCRFNMWCSKEETFCLRALKWDHFLIAFVTWRFPDAVTARDTTLINIMTMLLWWFWLWTVSRQTLKHWIVHNFCLTLFLIMQNAPFHRVKFTTISCDSRFCWPIVLASSAFDIFVNSFWFSCICSFVASMSCWNATHSWCCFSWASFNPWHSAWCFSDIFWTFNSQSSFISFIFALCSTSYFCVVSFDVTDAVDSIISNSWTWFLLSLLTNFIAFKCSSCRSNASRASFFFSDDHWLNRSSYSLWHATNFIFRVSCAAILSSLWLLRWEIIFSPCWIVAHMDWIDVSCSFFICNMYSLSLWHWK